MEYTYPAQANISAGAKDLVAQLLKHNPMHRLPIQGVLSHPWVVERSTKKPVTLNHEERSQWALLYWIAGVRVTPAGVEQEQAVADY